nr:MAG: polyprotein [Coprinopsis endornavirus 1]
MPLKKLILSETVVPARHNFRTLTGPDADQPRPRSLTLGKRLNTHEAEASCEQKAAPCANKVPLKYYHGDSPDDRSWFWEPPEFDEARYTLPCFEDIDPDSTQDEITADLTWLYRTSLYDEVMLAVEEGEPMAIRKDDEGFTFLAENGQEGVEEREVLVGGEGDCWHLIAQLFLKTFSVPHLQDFERVGAFVAEKLAAQGYSEPRSLSDLQEITKRFFSSVTVLVKAEWQSPTMLHIVEAMKAPSGREYKWLPHGWQVLADLEYHPHQGRKATAMPEKRVHIPEGIRHDSKRDLGIDTESLKLECAWKIHKILQSMGIKQIGDAGVLVGAPRQFMLNSEFFEQIRLLIDDTSGPKYVTAISDHDTRVVNNYFSRVKMMYLTTTTPSPRLADGDFKDLSNVLFKVNAESFDDPDSCFVRDVCVTYAFNNIDPSSCEYDDACMATLLKQDWFNFESNDKAKYMLSTSPTIEDVLKHDFTFAVLPRLTSSSEGLLHNEMGYQFQHDGTTWFVTGNNSDAKPAGWWTGIAQGQNDFVVPECTVSVVARKTIYNMQVVVLTTLRYENTTVLSDEIKEFDVPVLRPDFLHVPGLNIFSLKRCSLNKELLNRLINKHLTGLVGVDTLIEYGMALTWYSYNKRGVELSNTKITPEDVRTHVYLARVLVARQKINDTIFDSLTSAGISQYAARMLNAIFNVAVGKSTIGENNIPDVVMKLLEIFKTPTVRTNSGSTMNDFLSIDAWTMSENVRVANSCKTMVCDHHATCHGQNTELRCRCCGSLTASVDGGLCLCCTPNSVKCTHHCDIDHAGDDKCICCEKPCTGELCGCCLAVTPRPTKTEAKATSASEAKQHPTGKKLHDDTFKYTMPGGKVVDARKAVSECVANKDGSHTHTCVRCGNDYAHTHHYTKLMHPLFVGDCPWCEGNMSNPKIGESQAKNESDAERRLDMLGDPDDDIPEHSEAELASALDPLAVAITKRGLELDAQFGNVESIRSEIPFVCAGASTEPLSNFKFTKIRDAGEGDCGHDCLEWYVGNVLSDNVIKKLCKKTRGLNSGDLTKVLLTYELNAMIVDAAGAHFQRQNMSPEFCVIIHESAQPDSEMRNHWMVATATRVELAGTQKYYSPAHTAQQHENYARNLLKMQYSSLSDKGKLHVSYLLSQNSKFTVMDSPFCLYFDGRRLSNNEKYSTDESQGWFSEIIRDDLQPLVRMMVDAVNNRALNDDLNKVWDTSDNDKFNVEQNVYENFRDVCLKMTQTFFDPAKECRSATFVVNVDRAGNYVDLSSYKVKNGDVVFLRNGSQYVPITAKMKENRMYVKQTTIAGLARLDLLIPKASVASQIYRLCSLNNVSVSTEQLEKLYRNGTFVLGFGGSGKTTGLVEWRATRKETIDFIAVTSGGVTSLRGKLPKSDIPMSFEKATRRREHSETVVIDEATLLRPWEVALAIGPNTRRIYLLGDPLQIAVIDMFASGGTRLTFDALQAAREVAAVKILTHTYRLGPTLVNEIKQNPALADLESRADHDTTFDTMYLDAWDGNAIIDAASDVNVVIVFYQDHKHRVQKIVGPTKRVLLMDTVHGFQGLERKRVLVIQAPQKNAFVHLQLGHCVSAATRASHHLKWLSIQCYDAKTPLHKRLGTAVGAWDVSKELVAEIEGKEQPMHTKPLIWADQINLDEPIPNYDRKAFSAKRLTEHISSQTNLVKLKCTAGVDYVRITFSAGFASADITVNDDGSYSTDVPMDLRKPLLAAIANSCDGKAEDEVETALVPKSKVYRVRILSHVIKVYAANGLKLTRNIDGHNITLESPGNHCAACGPIEMIRNGEPTGKIEKDYLISEARQVTGVDQSVLLDIIASDKFYEFVIPELDDVELSHAILTERIDTAMSDFTDKNTGFAHYMWQTKFDNTLLAEQIQKAIGLTIITTNYDRMSWYPFFKDKLFNRKLSTIRENKRITTTRKSNVHKQEEILLCLVEMHQYYRSRVVARIIAKQYMKRVGAIDRIPGMVESVSWHETRKTEAYFKLVNHIERLEIKSLKNKRENVYCPMEVFANITDNFTKRNFTTNNYNCLGDAPTQAADLFALKCLFDQHPLLTIDCAFSTSYAAYVVGATGKDLGTIRQLLPKAGSQERLQWQLTAVGYDKSLFNHASKLSATDEAYQQLINEINHKRHYHVEELRGDCLLLGPGSLNDDGERLVDAALTRRMDVYAWVPTITITHPNSAERWLKRDKSTLAWPMSKAWCDAIFNGHTYKFANKRLVSVHTMRHVADIMFVKIQSKDYEVWLSPSNFEGNKIQATIPAIIMDPREALNSKQLLKNKTIMVNSHLMDNLLRRLLKPGTTFEDLLVQTRTLINTVQFNTHSVSERYKNTVAEAYDTAKLAWLINKYELAQFGMLGGDLNWFTTAMASMSGYLFDSLLPESDESEVLEQLAKLVPTDLLKKIVMNFSHTASILSSKKWKPVRKVKVNGSLLRIPQLVKRPEVNKLYTKITTGMEFAIVSTCDVCTDTDFTYLFKALGTRPRLTAFPKPSDIVVGSVGCDHVVHVPIDGTQKNVLTPSVGIATEYQYYPFTDDDYVVDLGSKEIIVRPDDHGLRGFTNGVVQFDSWNPRAYAMLLLSENCTAIVPAGVLPVTIADRNVNVVTSVTQEDGRVTRESLTVATMRADDVLRYNSQVRDAWICKHEGRGNWKTPDPIHRYNPFSNSEALRLRQFVQKERGQTCTDANDAKEYAMRYTRAIYGDYHLTDWFAACAKRAMCPPPGYISAHIRTMATASHKARNHVFLTFDYDWGSWELHAWAGAKREPDDRKHLKLHADDLRRKHPSRYDSKMTYNDMLSLTYTKISTSKSYDETCSLELVVNPAQALAITELLNHHMFADARSQRHIDTIRSAFPGNGAHCYALLPPVMSALGKHVDALEFVNVCDDGKGYVPKWREPHSTTELSRSYVAQFDHPLGQIEYVGDRRTVTSPVLWFGSLRRVREINVSGNRVTYHTNANTVTTVHTLPSILQSIMEGDAALLQVAQPSSPVIKMELNERTHALGLCVDCDRIIEYLVEPPEHCCRPDHSHYLVLNSNFTQDAASVAHAVTALDAWDLLAKYGYLQTMPAPCGSENSSDQLRVIVRDSKRMSLMRELKDIVADASIHPKMQDQISLLLRVTGNKRASLPPKLDSLLRNGTHDRVKIWTNPLMMSHPRLADCKDMLHPHNTHWMSDKLMKHFKLNRIELEFMEYLYAMVLDLSSAHEGDVHLYSLKNGVAMRRPSINPGLHVNIGVKDPAIESLGFVTLELAADPGRFGACLRPIVAMLWPKRGQRIFVHSGRPSLHPFWCEWAYMVANLGKWSDSNIVFGPWRGYAPFLDGYSMVHNGAAEDEASYISQNLIYGQVYGIDESYYKALSIDVCFNSATAPWWYSSFTVTRTVPSDINVAVVSYRTVVDQEWVHSMDLVHQSTSGGPEVKHLVTALDDMVVDGRFETQPLKNVDVKDLPIVGHKMRTSVDSNPPHMLFKGGESPFENRRTDGKSDENRTNTLGGALSSISDKLASWLDGGKNETVQLESEPTMYPTNELADPPTHLRATELPDDNPISDESSNSDSDSSSDSDSDSLSSGKHTPELSTRGSEDVTADVTTNWLNESAATFETANEGDASGGDVLTRAEDVTDTGLPEPMTSQNLESGKLHSFDAITLPAHPFYDVQPKMLYDAATPDKYDIVYNPQTAKDCVWHCISQQLAIRGLPLTTIEHMKQWFKIPPFVDERSIPGYLLASGLNFSYTGGHSNCAFLSSPEAECSHFMIIRQPGTNNTHLVVVDAEVTLTPFSRRQTSLLPELTAERADDLKIVIGKMMDTLEAGQHELQNLAHRLRGHYVDVSSRNRGVQPITCVHDKQGWYSMVTGLIDGKAYLVFNGERLILNMPFTDDNNTQWLLGNLPDFTYAIDIGVTLIDRHMTTRETRTQNKIGWHTATDRRFAVAHSLPDATLPINPGADVQHFVYFDNRDHHHLKSHSIAQQIGFCNMRFANLEFNDTATAAKFEKSLMCTGPIRLGVREGTLYLNAVSRSPWQEILESVVEEAGILGPRPLMTIPMVWHACEWQRQGNVLIPTADLITPALERLGWRADDPHRVTIRRSTLGSISRKVFAGVPGDAKTTYHIRRLDAGECAWRAATAWGYNKTLGTCADLDSLVQWEVLIVGYGKKIAPEDELIAVDDVKHDVIDFKGLNTVEVKETHELGEQTMQTIDSLSSINSYPYEDSSDSYEVKEWKGSNLLYVGKGIETGPVNGDIVEEMVAPHIMNYWDDETGMMPGVVNLPNKEIKLKKNAEFEGIKAVSKAIIGTQYPTHAQPGFGQRFNAALQASSELFGGKLTLREVEHNPREDANKFASTYFVQGASSHLEPVHIDPKAVAEWLKERPDCVKIASDLEAVLSGGLDIEGMDKVNVHLKMESRMKDVETWLTHAYDTDMPGTIEEQRIRLIVWQRKGITAIFAGFFLKLKENLKRALRKEVVYADGMTPAQISALFRQVEGDCVFAEDDLKKQDRQTDATLIATEMEIYKKLGGNPGVVDLWSAVHKKWRAKGAGLKFEGEASRHTGQATTALGNFIVNLMVKERVVRELGKNLYLMIGLGDDNLIICRPGITKTQIERNSARHFNMKSSAVVRSDYGTFLRMMVYRNNTGRVECGPDMLRLRRRFEVTNGVSEANDVNIRMRAMSYCCMIGNLPVIAAAAAKQELPVELETWYEYASLRKYTANKYECSEDYIDSTVNRLAKSISELQVKEVSKLMFTEKGH